MSEVSNIRAAKSAERQASEWLVLMEEGAPSPEDRARFEAWLREPRHRAAYAELEETWGRLGAIHGHPRARGARDGADPIAEHLARSGRRRSARRFAAWAAAASVLLLLLAGAWLYPRTQEMHYATAVGAHRTVILPDGSRLELNTDTAVSVSYSRSLRRVTLGHGEAYFDVTGDELRPFVVAAGPGAVRAVGTEFVVRLISPENVTVIVTEGAVELMHTDLAPTTRATRPSADPSPTLTQGQRAEFDRQVTRIEDVPPQELARAQAWRRGMLIFDGQTLDAAIREVNRYTDTRLVISDDELRELRIGGVFMAGDIDAFLEVLEKSFDIVVARTGRSTVYLHASPTPATGDDTEA